MVVRGHDNIVRVLFDGTGIAVRICALRTKATPNPFFCPYHGWTYRNTGELSGVPSIHTAYKALD